MIKRFELIDRDKSNLEKSENYNFNNYPTMWDFGWTVGSSEMSCQTDKDAPTYVINTEDCLV